MSDKVNWEEAADGGFVGLDTKQLREAGKVFGVEFGPRASNDFMREKLCAVVGKPVSGTQEAPKPSAVVRSLTGFDPKPNLTASGKWEGRMRRVMIPNTLSDKNSRQIGVPLTWEDKTIYVFFDREVDIPEPHFHCLNNARGAHIQPVTRRRDDGSVEVTNVERPFKAIPFQDLGITPCTEGLPTSLADYWKRQAKKHDNFSKTPRATLIKIRSDLIGPAGRAYYKDLSDEDIRIEVLDFLGLEEAMAA